MTDPYDPCAPARRRLPAALLLALACTWPPSAAALDLRGAYEAAVGHDALVESARRDVLAASERRVQAEALLKPSLGASATLNTAQVDNNLIDPRTLNYQTAGVALNIPVYRPATGSSAEQAAVAERIAQARLDQAEQDLATRVAQAYFDALAADDAVAVAEAQRTAIAEQFAAAKRNFEVGTATITDQQEAQARLDLNDALLAGARNDLTVRISALRTLTGVEPLPLYPLRRDAVLPRNAEIDPDAFARRARDDNFQVRQAELAADVARKQLEQARYGQRPTLDIVGQAAYTRGRSPSTLANPLIDRSSNVGAALQLTVPLYAGGGLDAREREAVALVGRAEADLENARRATEQAARQVFLGLNSNLEQVGALEAAERSSRLALESNLLGYQVGVRINVDVLNAQQQWFTTRRDLSRARYDVLVNTLRLKAAAGALREPDITAVNSLLVAPDKQRRETDVPTPSGPRKRSDASRQPGPARPAGSAGTADVPRGDEPREIAPRPARPAR